MKTLYIDGQSLTLEDIKSFILENREVKLTEESEKKVLKARKQIEEWVEEEKIIYGVTTGFGEFANVTISKEKLSELQENLIISHSAGVGDPLPPVIVKIMMLLRVNALARGHSGIKLETLKLLIAMINNNIIPVIPSQGSVGSSGDLAPLSHLVLALIGKGEVRIVGDLFDEKSWGAQEDSLPALERFSLSPVTLGAKEGLALINGTQMMTAYASFICIKAEELMKTADIASAMTHEALRATDNAYDLRLHNLRPYDGQIRTAQNIKKLIAGSEIRESHKENDPRVQDSYSLRCIPQIHGASKDAANYVRSKVEVEINSVNDNPIIFPEDGDYIEGGNFHGQPMALALDFMAIALSEIANVSERRTERMINGTLSNLPRFLTKKGGLNSGLMIAQYTSASLVSENKSLAHPGSVDSIPTSANQEDHNSMGSISARKCYQILKNVQKVIAIELMTAAQGVEFLKPLKCGAGTTLAYNKIREYVLPLEEDRILYKDMQKMINLVENSEILNSVETNINLDI